MQQLHATFQMNLSQPEISHAQQTRLCAVRLQTAFVSRTDCASSHPIIVSRSSCTDQSWGESCTGYCRTGKLFPIRLSFPILCESSKYWRILPAIGLRRQPVLLWPWPTCRDLLLCWCWLPCRYRITVGGTSHSDSYFSGYFSDYTDYCVINLCNY
jgi:hypothetical protein